jgi:hypothetical protein
MGSVDDLVHRRSEPVIQSNLTSIKGDPRGMTALRRRLGNHLEPFEQRASLVCPTRP